MEGTAQIRYTADNWSLAGDRQLLQFLNLLHQKIRSKCEETNSKLQQMCSALDTASVSLQNVNNRFLSLSATQFIESRVYEDDTDTPQSASKQELVTSSAFNNNDVTQLKQSLKRLEWYHEPVHILPDSDSDSDSDSDTHTQSMVYRLRELYAQRPLPYTIGTKQWKEKWHAGLVVEESDSNSEGSATGAGGIPLDYSSDESDGDIEEDDALHQRTSQIWREEEESSSEPAAPAASEPLVSNTEDKYYKHQSELAAEVARRLTGTALYAPQVEPTPEDESPVPTAAPGLRSTPAPASSLFRPQPHTRLTGAVFSDEPPPIEYDHGRDNDNDDIFAELEDDHLCQKETKVRDLPPISKPGRETSPLTTREPDTFKKPVGAISLFGDSRGAETIGDAILERTRAHPQKQQHSQDKKLQESASEREERILRSDDRPKTREDVFADLFSKAAPPQSDKPQKYDIKDDLFDDVDDLFTANIVSTVHVKEPDKIAPGLFDDDDLFADLDLGVSKNAPTEPKDKNKNITKIVDIKSRGIFEEDSEDDLFSDKHIIEINTENNTDKSQILQKPQKEQKILPKNLFDDDDGEDLFLTIPKSDDIKKESSSVKSLENGMKNIQENTSSREDVHEKDDILKSDMQTNLIHKTTFSSPVVFDDDDIDDLFTTRSLTPKVVVGDNKQTYIQEEPMDKSDKERNDENLSDFTDKEIHTDKHNIEKQNMDQSNNDMKTFITRNEIPESVVNANISDIDKESIIAKNVASDNLDVQNDSNISTKITNRTIKIFGVDNVTQESHLEISEQIKQPHENENLSCENERKVVGDTKILDATSIAITGKTHLKNHLLFNDDDTDGLFQIDDVVEGKSKNTDVLKDSSKRKEPSTDNDSPTNIKTTPKIKNLRSSNTLADEFLDDDDDDMFKGKNKSRDEDRASSPRKISFDAQTHTNVESDHYDINKGLKPEILQKPNRSIREKAVSKNNHTDFSNHDELFQKQGNSKAFQNEGSLPNEQKIEVKKNTHGHVDHVSDGHVHHVSDGHVDHVSDEDDNFSPPPLAPNTDIFHDIYSDQPPDFLKPIESKKSKNINALFDDDSDDEALFFKRNDNLIDEKLDEASANDKSLAFGLFSDEPPDLDFDFEQKNKINVPDKILVPSKNVFDDSIFSEHEPPKSPAQMNKDDRKIDNSVADNVNKSVHAIETISDKHSPLNFPKKVNKGVDDADGILHSKESKVVGKLKGVNINIDVHALIPGASPIKNIRLRNTEEPAKEDSSALNQEGSERNTSQSTARAINFDEDPDSLLLCNRLSKDRAKIQVKRRPSSRKARKEAARKSCVQFTEDLDTTDASDGTEQSNTKIEKEQEKSELAEAKNKSKIVSDEVTINTLGKVYSNITKEDVSKDSDEELFGRTTQISIEKHENVTTEEKVATAAIVKDAGEQTNSFLSDDDDDDIFKTFSKNDAKKPKGNAVKERKSLFDDLSDDELLFAHAPTRGPGNPNDKGTSERPPRLPDDLEELPDTKSSSVSVSDHHSKAASSTGKRNEGGGAGGGGAQLVFDDPLSAFQDP